MAGRRKAPASVTGRDGYIIGKALVYAIAQIQSLPARRQEFSDMCDMCALVRAIGVDPWTVAGVQRHVDRTVDLNVDRERSDPEGSA